MRRRLFNKFVGVQDYKKLLNENKILREKIADGNDYTKCSELYKKLAYNEVFFA